VTLGSQKRGSGGRKIDSTPLGGQGPNNGRENRNYAALVAGGDGGRIESIGENRQRPLGGSNPWHRPRPAPGPSSTGVTPKAGSFGHCPAATARWGPRRQLATRHQPNPHCRSSRCSPHWPRLPASVAELEAAVGKIGRLRAHGHRERGLGFAMASPGAASCLSASAGADEDRQGKRLSGAAANCVTGCWTGLGSTEPRLEKPPKHPVLRPPGKRQQTRRNHRLLPLVRTAYRVWPPSLVRSGDGGKGPCSTPTKGS